MPDADPFAAADMQDSGAAAPVMNALFGSKGPGAIPGEIADTYADVPKEVLRQLDQAGAQWRADVTQPDPSKTPGQEVGYDVKMLGDFLNVPGSIITGLATSVVGRPLEQQTNIPREVTGNIVALAAPFLVGRAAMSRPGQAYLANQLASRLPSGGLLGRALIPSLDEDLSR